MPEVRQDGLVACLLLTRERIGNADGSSRAIAWRRAASRIDAFRRGNSIAPSTRISTLKLHGSS
jgi:hypothetical protein